MGVNKNHQVNKTRLYQTSRDRPFLFVATKIHSNEINLCNKMSKSTLKAVFMTECLLITEFVTC